MFSCEKFQLCFVFTLKTVCFLLLLPSAALAQKILKIGVTGAILNPPEWQGSSGQPLTELGLTFNSYGGAKTSNIISEMSKIKLANAISYPAVVSFRGPTKCSIGTYAVRNSRIVLVINGLDVSSNRTLDISNNSFNSVALKIKAVPPNKTGAVICAGFGSLTYSY